MHERPGLGIAIALCAALFYGLISIAARGAFEAGVPPIDTVLVRTLFLALVLGGVAFLRREALAPRAVARSAFAAQVIATLLVSVGYIASVQFIPVSLAVIIFYTFPVLIMLVSPLIEGHAPGVLRLAIACFAFSGLAISVGPSFETLDLRGIALAGAGAIGCALQSFTGRALSRYMMPAALGSTNHLALSPLVAAIALWSGGGRIATLSTGAATVIGLLCVAAVCVLYLGGYLAHMLSLRFAPASTVAPFYNLEPVITTVGAALLLGERLGTGQYVGGGMVLAALVASGFAGKRRMSGP